MFTGIVEGLGNVTAITRQGVERRFAIRPLFKLPELADGDSIAVNGACLTVEAHSDSAFTVYASGETVANTNLGDLRNGAQVNLERALQLGSRLNGHIVSGHVDCVAQVENISKAGESLLLRLRFPERFSGQIISKGSVALNGISLTVNQCGKDFLEVNAIPESQARTNLPLWRPGVSINMETDIIGKYVQHLLSPWQKQGVEISSSAINFDFLAKNGFV